jgi:hypothetical protein
LFIDERAEISEDLREFVYTGFDLKDFWLSFLDEAFLVC